MGNESEVTVKVKAVIDEFTDNMEKANSHFSQVAGAMEGNLGGMAQGFGNLISMSGSLGPMALGVGAVALAAEGLKKAFEFTEEAVEHTNALARSFEGLQFQTGESLERLNEFNAAMVKTGGDVEQLQTWMISVTRAMRANADEMVRNGIAADKATLMSMPFVDYLKNVLTSVENVEDPQRRLIILQETLGRAGIQSVPQIRRFIEELEAQGKTHESVAQIIKEKNIESMHEMIKTEGELKLATMELSAGMTEAMKPMIEWWNELKIAVVSTLATLVAGTDQLVAKRTAIVSAYQGMKAQEDALWNDLKAQAKKGGMEVGQYLNWWKSADPAAAEAWQKRFAYIREEAGKLADQLSDVNNKLKDKGYTGDTRNTGQLDAAKPVAAEYGGKKEEKNSEKVAHTAEEWAEIDAVTKVGIQRMLASQKDGIQQEKDALKMAVDEREMTRAEELQNLAMLSGREEEVEVEALTKELGMHHKHESERAAIQLKITEAHMRGAAERRRLADEEATYEISQAKRSADTRMQEELSAAQKGFEIQKNVIKQKVEAFQLTDKQAVAATKAAAQEQETAELAALSRELAAYAHTSEEVQAIMKKRSEIIQKYMVEETRANADAVKLQMSNWKKLGDAIQGDLSTAFQSVIDKSTTMGQKVQSLFSSIGKSIMKMLSDVAAREIMEYAKSQLASHKTAASKVMDNAAVAGTAGAASAAQDGPYGWMIAIPVGLGILAAAKAMFSAEGGFDVPAGMNPVTQLHQSEMVLPAEHADTIRGLKNQSGGQTHVHIHAMDAKSFKQALQSNQGGLLDVINDAVRNRRSR